MTEEFEEAQELDPTEPDPEVVEQTTDIWAEVEAALQSRINGYARRHPATWRAIRRRINNPARFVVGALRQDEAYRSLVERTEDSTQLAALTAQVIPVAFNLLERFLLTL